MPVDVKRLANGVPYEAAQPLASLLEDLDQIDQFVDDTESSRRNMRRLGVVFLLGFGLMLVTVPFLDGWAILLAVLSLITAIVFFVRGSTYRTHVIEHRYWARCARELLQVLAVDIAPKTPFRISLQLKSASKPALEQPYSARKSGTTKLFRTDWLNLEGTFLDGTSCLMHAVEVRRVRNWRNPRGKYKTKSREQHVVTLRLNYDPKRYHDASQLKRHVVGAIRLPQNTVVKGWKATEKSLALKVLVKDPPKLGQTATMMFLSLYKVLNASRGAHGNTQGAKGARR